MVAGAETPLGELTTLPQTQSDRSALVPDFSDKIMVTLV